MCEVVHGYVEVHFGFAGAKANDRAVNAVALVQFGENPVYPSA